MLAQKEKTLLMVQILEKFAPYMDRSTDLFKEMGATISSFGTLVESMSDLPEDKKTEFVAFIKTFNTYIEGASNNYTELSNFYSFLAGTTNNIIAEYKAAMGIE